MNRKETKSRGRLVGRTEEGDVDGEVDVKLDENVQHVLFVTACIYMYSTPNRINVRMVSINKTRR